MGLADIPLTRRQLLAGVLAAPLVIHGNVFAQIPDYVIPVMLDSGIEVRDYRIFPMPDVRRFIVEVHNTTDAPVDTPTLGVILPHLPKEEGFGVAVPASPVLHPHTSGVLIGAAPAALMEDNSWGTPEWMPCNTLTSTLIEGIAGAEIDVVSRLEVAGDTWLKVFMDVTNRGDTPVGRSSEVARYGKRLAVHGCFFDADNRVCGIMQPWIAWNLQAGETQSPTFSIDPAQGYIGNPFHLVDAAEGLTLVTSIQPFVRYKPVDCPVVMPWNR